MKENSRFLHKTIIEIYKNEHLVIKEVHKIKKVKILGKVSEIN